MMWIEILYSPAKGYIKRTSFIEERQGKCMKQRHECNTYLMWTSPKPKQQEGYRIPLYLPALYEAIKKKERQEKIKNSMLTAFYSLIKLLIGGMAGIITAGFLVPYIANLRGYMAYGGEWILIYLAIFAAVKIANKYLR